MGEPPTNKHQIDRTKNDEGYNKENCLWVTRKINNRNKRSNRLITFNNETKCLMEWAEKYGINPKTLWHRFVTLGWTTEEALTIPVKKRGRRI
jgi:hypothetical protein